MNRLYSTILALSFVTACGKLEDTVESSSRRGSVQSIDRGANPNYQNVASQVNPGRNSCSGPPNIQHLFDAYKGMKEHVDKSGSVGHPVVERVYAVAEAEMQRARRLLDLCRQSSDNSLAEFYYLSANQFAVSAIAWIGETMRRVEEPIVFKTDAAEW